MRGSAAHATGPGDLHSGSVEPSHARGSAGDGDRDDGDDPNRRGAKRVFVFDGHPPNSSSVEDDDAVDNEMGVDPEPPTKRHGGCHISGEGRSAGRGPDEEQMASSCSSSARGADSLPIAKARPLTLKEKAAKKLLVPKAVAVAKASARPKSKPEPDQAQYEPPPSSPSSSSSSSSSVRPTRAPHLSPRAGRGDMRGGRES